MTKKTIKKYWFENSGNENDVAISSRIRFARNIDGFAFGKLLTDESAADIIKMVSDILAKLQGYSLIDMGDLTPVNRLALTEKHIISKEFAAADNKRGLILNNDGSHSVMLCEEDHLRIQCLSPGFNIDELFKQANEIDDIVDKGVKYAFNEFLGYLTHCPTNLGTAMRASVMLHLPALTMIGSINKVLSAAAKLGVAVRGIYGEGSEAAGALYQISNQITMGLTEEQTIDKLKTVVSQIIDNERAARNAIQSQGEDQLADRVFRSLGLLKYARLLNTEEFMERISDLRLGVAMGVIQDITLPEIDTLTVYAQYANTILLTGNEEADAQTRDLSRAEYVRSTLAV